MLEVGEAEDARLARGGAELVRDGELLQPQHTLSAPRQLVDRRRAHPAGADDDLIEDLAAHARILWRHADPVNQRGRSTSCPPFAFVRARISCYPSLTCTPDAGTCNAQVRRPR